LQNYKVIVVTVLQEDDTFTEVDFYTPVVVLYSNFHIGMAWFVLEIRLGTKGYSYGSFFVIVR
jgi:hypothetical protein